MVRRKPEVVKVAKTAAATVLLCLLAFLVWFQFFSAMFLVRVSGNSMEPTLKSGRYYLGHSTKKVERGDIVVFRKHGTTYVKRIVGVGGDHMYLVSEFLDDGSLIWTQVIRGGNVTDDVLRAISEKVLIIPDDYFWVEGDSWSSEGSGEFGLVTVQEILGTIDD